MRWSGLLLLILSLLVAGCANNGEASDGDKQNGFYGSISGGGAWP